MTGPAPFTAPSALALLDATTTCAPAPVPLVAHGYARRDWLLRRLLALSDVAALAGAIALTGSLAVGQAQRASHTMLICAVVTLPAWVVLFKLYGLYDGDCKRLGHSTLDDVPALFHGLLVGCLLSWCWFLLAAPQKLVYSALLTFATFAMLGLLGARSLARRAFLALAPPERLLLIGTGRLSGTLIAKMTGRASLRLRAVGAVTCAADDRQSVPLPHLGCLDQTDLPALIREHRVGRVVLAEAEIDGERLLRVLRDCKSTSVKVSLMPAGYSALGPSVQIDDVQGVTVLGINPPVLSRSSRLAKRILDLTGAGLLLALATPLLAVCAVAIKLDSRGPVLFTQERVGRAGRRFRMVKLRTMSVDAEARRSELLAQSKHGSWLHLDRDPRVTRVGRLLRLASIDELPQLLNVLGAQMSLVGPRPLVAEEDRMVDDWARGRLDLTPGITGLWQVLGRTSIPFEEMVKLDYLYVTNWSLWGDVRLILRTLPVVLSRKGAN